MAIFGFSLDDLKEILKESEIRIIARINQIEAQIEKNTNQIKELKQEIKRLKGSLNKIDEMLNKPSKEKKRGSPKAEIRNKEIIDFLKNPHNTKEVCEKFGYTRSYASFLLNRLKKKGLIKIHSKVGNIPYFIKKET